MSAFLGPIHYWLFNKIQIQNEIVEKIISLDKTSLREKLDTQYGIFPIGDLEDIVDDTNIHGWLQQYVSQVEYKLATSSTVLINQQAENIALIREIFFNKGKEIAQDNRLDSASDIYKIITNSLLDGMPCDHANSLVEENEHSVVWKRNTCVHSSYWEEIGGIIEYYYIFREEFIRGILDDSNYIYERTDETTNIIRKEG